MDFYINRGSSLPHLKVKIFSSDNTEFETLSKVIKTAKVTFSMKNLSNNVYKIASKRCEIQCRHTGSDEFSDIMEYYILYEWGQKDVNTTGTYIGEFNITFKNQSCENLVVPIREKLYVIIQDSLN